MEEHMGSRPNRKATNKQGLQEVDDDITSQDPRYDEFDDGVGLPFLPLAFAQHDQRREQQEARRTVTQGHSSAHNVLVRPSEHPTNMFRSLLLCPNRSYFNSIVMGDHYHHTSAIADGHEIGDDAGRRQQDVLPLPTPFHPAIGRPTSVIIMPVKQPETAAWLPTAESALLHQYSGDHMKNIGGLQHLTNLSSVSKRNREEQQGWTARARSAPAGSARIVSQEEPSDDRIADGFGIKPRMGDNDGSSEELHYAQSSHLAQHDRNSLVQHEQEEDQTLLNQTRRSPAFPQAKHGFYPTAQEGSTSLAPSPQDNEEVYIRPLPLSPHATSPAATKNNPLNSADCAVPTLKWASIASEQRSTTDERTTTPPRWNERSPFRPNSASVQVGLVGPTLLKPLNSRNFFYSEMRGWLLRLDDNQLQTLRSRSSATAPTPTSSLKMDGQSYVRATLLAHGGTTQLSREERMEHLLSLRLSKAQRKRKHRKVHGKLTFHQMNALIDSEWRILPAEEKEFYKEVARADKARYERELELRRNEPKK